MMLRLNSSNERITISEEERCAFRAIATGDEWVTFRERIADRCMAGSLRKAEHMALDMGLAFMEAISEDHHCDAEIEVMTFWLNRFARAMNVVIDHYDTPRSSDDLQEAAIDLAYFSWCMGITVESPEILVEGKRFKTAVRRNNAQKANNKRKKWEEYVAAFFRESRCRTRPGATAEMIYNEMKPLLPIHLKMPKDETVHKYICKLRKGIAGQQPVENVALRQA